MLSMLHTRQAMPPKAFPKLPIKLITDPSVGGALHAIALKVFDVRRQRGLKAIEWQNPGKRKEVCLQRGWGSVWVHGHNSNPPVQ
jgi:hypothetical protein